ncbi:hypothetical protein K438DRAFT_1754782 [Mycena galopus ATCC 62051]|nr:hypothetical protein K438DRAFT_1754782 [Mycena galopus ATCC 62051]
MASPVSITGKNLPLDVNFDFIAWRKASKEIDIPMDMGLQERNAHNCKAETFNRASIDVMRKYELDLKQGPAPDTSRDMGPPLQPYYKYETEELELMIASDDYCNKVVAPVPPLIFSYIAKERICIAKEKEEAKEKGPEVLGTMFLTSTPLKKATDSSGKSILNCKKLIQDWGSDDTTVVQPVGNTLEPSVDAFLHFELALEKGHG